MTKMNPIYSWSTSKRGLRSRGGVESAKRYACKRCAIGYQGPDLTWVDLHALALVMYDWFVGQRRHSHCCTDMHADRDRER